MKRKLAITLFIILLLSCAFLTIWGRDESLSEEVSQQLQKPIVATEKNAYFQLQTFTAPIQKGQAELHFTRNVFAICDKNEKNLADCVIKNRASIDAILNENKDLLQRYRLLFNYSEFSGLSPGDLGFSALSFVDLQRTKLALWAQSILLLQDGQKNEALELIQGDTRFWRMLLAKSDNLLTRMVAVSILQKQYELLSHIVVYFPSLAIDEKDKLLQLVSPLSVEEFSFRRALTGELRVIAAALTLLDDCALKSDNTCASIPKTMSWMLGNPLLQKTLLYRRNATLNLQARLINQWATFTELPPKEIVKQKELILHSLEQEYKPEKFSAIYNRIGRQLVATGFVDIRNYSLKVHDLDGLLRLINLQIQISALHLPDERIGPFLQTSGSELTNPYSGEAMIWDAKERTLSFPSQGNERGGEIAVQLTK